MMQVSDSLVSLLSDLGWFELREMVEVGCMGPAFSMKYTVYSVGQSLGMKLSQTLGKLDSLLGISTGRECQAL